METGQHGVNLAFVLWHVDLQLELKLEPELAQILLQLTMD